MTYTIEISREEIKSLFMEAHEEFDGTRSVDEIVADKLGDRIVKLINSDLRR